MLRKGLVKKELDEWNEFHHDTFSKQSSKKIGEFSQGKGNQSKMAKKKSLIKTRNDQVRKVAKFSSKKKLMNAFGVPLNRKKSEDHLKNINFI